MKPPRNHCDCDCDSDADQNIFCPFTIHPDGIGRPEIEQLSDRR
jgi:hypothetical protein